MASSRPEMSDAAPRSSSTTSSRSRLSLTEVYERIREEEAKEYQRKQQEQQSRKERWKEGHQALADTSRRKSDARNKLQLDNQDSSTLQSIDAQDRIDADEQQAQETINSTHAELPEPASLAKPDPAPAEAKLATLVTSLPETDPSPADQANQSSLPPRTTDAAASRMPHTLTSPSSHESGTESVASLQAYELKTLLHLLKKTLNEPTTDLIDNLSDDASVTDMLRDLQANLRDQPIDTKHGVTNPRGLSDALAMGSNIQSIFKEDARYANRLNALRSRLGVLASELGSQKDIPSTTRPEHLEQTHANSPFRLNPTIFRSSSFKWVFFATLVLVLMTAVAVHVLQSYADHLAMYTFSDPFHPQIYPVPELLLKLRPLNVRYNVPFTAHYERSIAHLLIPTSEKFGE